ncbi:recombinase family protein [Acetobacter sp.]|uniref:recombinase family protein n=1 Tax=Acetobacter sp. TaxID=440 RepID=UPI0039E77274
MKRYGYARVSTEGQTNDPQLLSLRREGLSDDMITQDIISGGVPAMSRPGMSSLLKMLEAGDSLIAAKLDRLGRDTVDVIGLIRILNERCINLRILNIGVETNTPNGRLFLTILAAFAEFEREIIKERTLAGLEAARAAGKRLGRRPKLTIRQRSHALTMSASGHTNGQIADILGVSISTIQRITAQNTLQKAAF